MKYASDSHIINMEEIMESWREQGMNYQKHLMRYYLTKVERRILRK